jgi:hypothetical protein
MIVIGAVLLLVGAVLPFMMVVRWIESQLWLNFIAFASSMAGLVVGLFGVFEYQRSRSSDRGSRF